jgi:UDP-N-acetylglucosamine 2-epimerase (non-hydrolysing)
MKLAPLARELSRRDVLEHSVVHTGQHYDQNMSGSFFDDLGIPEPDHNLSVGSGSHAQQTGSIMQRLEPVLLQVDPNIVLVYGDVNSTVAAALVAAKLGISIGHVEAGLRSRDWSMPEEVNRVVTDRLSDLLFTPSRDADQNLQAEGITEGRIHFVGNVMIDSLVYALPRARDINAAEAHGLTDRGYAVVTLHRPSNVDDADTLRQVMEGLGEVCRDRPVIFPVHPRTRQQIQRTTCNPGIAAGLRLLDPLPYTEMLSLMDSAEFVITDSGGVQEETSYLGVPCITVRANTERPVTCSKGTNQLTAPSRAAIAAAARDASSRRVDGGANIECWDGRTASRITKILLAI